MTFRRYSRFISSSFDAGAGEPTLGEEGKSDVEGVGDVSTASEELSCLVMLLQ